METQAPGLKPQVFFPVSTQKFAILSIASFGIYPIYWFYQNWKRIRDAQVPHDGVPYHGTRVSPLLRATFAPLFIIPLLKRIMQQAEASRVAVTWNTLPRGLGFVAVSLMALLPDPWWLLSIGIFEPILAPLETCQQINAAAGNPEGVNDTYSAGNLATIFIGALTWMLLVVALTIAKPVTSP